MPGKKKKYNARFPPARIKKIMQTDEEVGKVAQAVPVIISRALELFADTLLNQANKVTLRRGARTLTPSHLKFCIENERKFDFLRDMVASVPDLQDDELEMEVDVIPILPAQSAPKPQPLSTNGRSQSNDNIFKEPQSRESTPGSPSNFPSPVSKPSTPTSTSRGSTPTSTSSRGGATPKRRGRPPKNGSLGRGFPPMPGDKRKLSDDTASWIQEAGYRLDSKPTCSESSSLPGSPLVIGVPPLHRANSHQGTNGRNPSTSGSSASTSSSGSREFNTSQNQNYNHQHHNSAWSSGNKLTSGLSRSNSTPTGFVFSVSPIEEGASSHGSGSGGGVTTTPSFTINVNPDLTTTQAASISSSSGHHSSSSGSSGHQSSSRGSSGHHSSYLPPTTSLNATSKSINSINKGDKKFGATLNNTGVKPQGRQMSVIHPPVRSSGTSSKKHNGQKSAGHKNDFKLYPRDNKGVFPRDTGGGYNQSDRVVGVITHPRDVGGEGLPMDLSKDGPLYAGKEELEPSLLQDLSRHNAFNTQGPGPTNIAGSSNTAESSNTATFSRFKPLDEDYDC